MTNSRRIKSFVLSKFNHHTVYMNNITSIGQLLTIGVLVKLCFIGNRYFLELRGEFSQWGMSEGNECQRWHGTRHDHQWCSLLGDYVFESGYCEDEGCNICNIASIGFILPTHTNRTQR
jgi:hypothetical protein